MVKSFYRRWKFIWNRYKLLSSVDFGLGENHFFLVSYPKSGNTWVRILLANLIKENNNEIALHNIGEYIPDSNIQVQLHQAFQPNSRFNKLPIKILKTHDPYFFFYKNKKVIYIVRDGRDTITSYYHYLIARQEHAPFVQDIIKGKSSMPIGAWSDYVCQWKQGTCNRKIIIKYEDLLKNPKTEVEKLTRFIELNINSAKMDKAIYESSLNKLKQLEKKYGHYNDTRTQSGKKISFFRKGEIGDSKNLLSKEDNDVFWKYSKKGMKTYDYK